jgi:hypothetical protein
MPYKASDFTKNWTNVPPRISSGNEDQQRHILDKEVLVDLLNIANIQLSESEMVNMRRVMNDGRINMHDYLSKSANVGNSEKYATENDCNQRKISDRSAVDKVRESFRKSEKVRLSSHEATHIADQVDVLLNSEFKAALSPAKYELLVATYRLYTNKVYGPEDCKNHTDGKLIDARILPVSEAAKDKVRKEAHKYLEALAEEASTQTKSEQSRATSLAAEAQSMKATNDAKYTAVVSYRSSSNRSCSSTECGGGSISSLAEALRQMNLQSHTSYAPRNYVASVPSMVADHYFPTSSRVSYVDSTPYHHSSSSSVSSSVSHNYPATRSGSNWDYFRSNVWTGGSRAEMSQAYQAWKGSL